MKQVFVWNRNYNSNMAQCINCHIALSKQQYLYSVMDMSQDIASIIEDWITHEVADGNHVCQECFNLLTLELCNRSKGSFGNRQLGHQSVCICCGISTSKRTGRRSKMLQSGTAEYAYISNIINIHLVPDNSRVCNACWQRASYRTLRNEPEVNAHDIQTQRRSSSRCSSSDDSQPSSELLNIKYQSNLQDDNIIILQGYSRTADTSNHCFVPQCHNVERRRVPLHLRKKILLDCKIFLTSNVRVCGYHSSMYNFEFLGESEFIPQFTSKQIVEMLDLLRNQEIKLV